MSSDLEVIDNQSFSCTSFWIDDDSKSSKAVDLRYLDCGCSVFVLVSIVRYTSQFISISMCKFSYDREVYWCECTGNREPIH